MNFGERLSKIRKELGFSQVSFAEKLRLNQQALSQYEKNKVVPSIEFIQKLTIIFDINSNWLLTGKGQMVLEDGKNRNSSSININNKDGKVENIAVSSGNGNIIINSKDYNVSNTEIEELLELLKDIPSSWIRSIIKKLKKSIEAIDNDFK